jgi:hypothetical protein
MTFVFVMGCILLLAQHISNHNNKPALFVLGAIFIPAILMSFFSAYHESRYIFHLYPLVVIVFAVSLIKILSLIPAWQYIYSQQTNLKQFLIITLVVTTILIISQDANPLYAWYIGNRTYQSARDPTRSIISWKPYATFHQDHESPSLYIKQRLLPGDQIVVLGPSYMLAVYHFYIGEVDYILEPSKGTLSYGKFKGSRIIDYATGSEILHGPQRLKELIANKSGGLWLLGDRILLSQEGIYYSKWEQEYLRSLLEGLDYVGGDGKTFAVKLK